MKYCVVWVFRLEYFCIDSKVQGRFAGWITFYTLNKALLAGNKQTSKLNAGFPRAAFLSIKSSQSCWLPAKYANENGDLDLSWFASLDKLEP